MVSVGGDALHVHLRPLRQGLVVQRELSVLQLHLSVEVLVPGDLHEDFQLEGVQRVIFPVIVAVTGAQFLTERFRLRGARLPLRELAEPGMDPGIPLALRGGIRLELLTGHAVFPDGPLPRVPPDEKIEVAACPDLRVELVLLGIEGHRIVHFLAQGKLEVDAPAVVDTVQGEDKGRKAHPIPRKLVNRGCDKEFVRFHGTRFHGPLSLPARGGCCWARNPGAVRIKPANGIAAELTSARSAV